MKYIIIICSIFFSSLSIADTYISPYVTEDGTYVPGHHRSDQDQYKSNNYSYPGNTNPYTWKEAPESDSTPYYNSSRHKNYRYQKRTF